MRDSKIVAAETYEILKRYRTDEYPLLGRTEERELIAAVQRGDKKAADKAIRSNIRLVVSIAKKYAGRGLPLEDLVQEGNTGLLEAINRFEKTKGTKLSTYAVWWIKRAMKSALAEQAGHMRLPPSTVRTIDRIKRVADALYQTLERPPTEEEIAEELGKSVAYVASYLSFVERCYVSVNSPVNGDESQERWDELVADPNTEETSVVMDGLLLTARIGEALAKLNERERAILEYRFGFRNDNGDMTLEKTGHLFKITRERVRQIEAKALRKLRGMERLLALCGGKNKVRGLP